MPDRQGALVLFIPFEAYRKAMDSENAGQYFQLMEGLQQFWHNPQLQQLYHLHAAQRNHNTQQVGSCPTNAQPTHPPPPATFAFK